MTLYRFNVDGRAHGPWRTQWAEAAQDAVTAGLALWRIRGQSVSLEDQAEIERLDPHETVDNRIDVV